ncbi:MAG: universal stress protein [Chloroflexi bacterium]|jgi:nucleotide-binding universal stress UspA family protein|nr:MAG: UspA domain-containing protein [Chloroflexi bacterium OLB13]MBC6957180.1 universal stress protein [Chloroflexota bacterium]MBV6435283.1 hypothetical protein [Anaerolineae bacterium]MDL1916191.1 universal stress protein [Anaerolineae bacterium CFX4]OQY80808.1 MAG: hypothetical protein B6D42_12320 [Anaerolineae bacterium UTCFX5]
MAFKKILVTLDGSDIAETAVKYAQEIVAPGGQITLLSVLEEDWAASLVMAGMIGQPVPMASDPRYASDPRALAAQREYLRGIQESFTRKDVTVQQEVVTGSVVESIIAVAEQGYDLIVMATHGRTGLGKVILGSVASDVLPKAPCPVLVIPPMKRGGGK